MRRNTLALAVLAACSAAASAQSSVTLYGVADAAVERIKGATSLTRVVSGQQAGSRWGLRGKEDLGGGLGVVFQLESGFNIDTGVSGQGGALFGRQAYVGMAGGFGAFRVGRQYTPMDDVADVIGTKAYDVLSVVPIIGNDDYNRSNNALTYMSPSLGGVTAQLQYSLGEERVRTNPSRDFAKQYSGNLMYGSGPVTAAVGLMRVVDADAAAADKQKKDALLVAGSYDFGAVKLTAYYDEEDKAAAKLKVFGAATAFKFGATTVSVGAAQAKNVNGSAGPVSDDANIFTLQVSHQLSPRTSLYAHATAVSNDEAAALGFNGPAAGSNSNGVQFGIRHRF